MRALIRGSVLALGLTLAGGPAFASDGASDAEIEAELDELIGTEGKEEAPAAADEAPARAPSYLRQSAEPKPAPLETKPESSVGFRAIAAIGLLLVLGAAALFLRRKQKSPLRPTQVHLSLVASVGVGHKAQICVVSVGREALLLGVTEHGVTPLRVYPEGELGLLTAQAEASKTNSEEDSAHQPVALTSAPEKSFQALLEKASGAKNVSKEAATRQAASRVEDLDELPAHLKSALESQAKRTRPAFDPPEGQASELARRFRNLQA